MFNHVSLKLSVFNLLWGISAILMGSFSSILQYVSKSNEKLNIPNIIADITV